jgi:hypothetical protein
MRPCRSGGEDVLGKSEDNRRALCKSRDVSRSENSKFQCRGVGRSAFAGPKEVVVTIQIGCDEERQVSLHIEEKYSAAEYLAEEPTSEERHEFMDTTHS